MMQESPRHTHEACPAYPYCETLAAYGVALDAEEGCLAPAMNEKTGGTAADPRLIEALKQEARRQAGKHFGGADEACFQALLEAHEGLFSCRTTLWKTMIDAARMPRLFTDVELRYHQQRITQAQRALAEAVYNARVETAFRAQAAHDRALKIRHQLQFDDAMIADINRLVGNVLNARPTLIVGDKGVAKTQVAKFVMNLYGIDPIVVSVKGDMMSDELIGKLKHDPRRNTFVFQDGILLTAMREGLPILLDEINFGDQAIIARLQDILLRRPGDVVFVQESGEEQVPVKPGFMVFATANEASQRYRHREILDPAIRDRFDIVMRSYPDLGNDPIIDTPADLLRLAYSSAVDSHGRLSTHIDERALRDFVQLAHITQYLYAVSAKNVRLEFADDTMKSAVSEDAEPLMTDCITPRTLSNVIADCAPGNLPDKKLDSKAIDRLLASLDQAGSTHNYDLAQQATLMLGIGIDEPGAETE